MERKNRRPVLQAAPGQTVQGRSLEIRRRSRSRRLSRSRRVCRMLNTCWFNILHSGLYEHHPPPPPPPPSPPSILSSLAAPA